MRTHARIRTDRIDAGMLASPRTADFLPAVWPPDPATERLRRLVARRNQVVRHRTRIKNVVHAVLHAHPAMPARRSVRRVGTGLARTAGLA